MKAVTSGIPLGEQHDRAHVVERVLSRTYGDRALSCIVPRNERLSASGSTEKGIASRSNIRTLCGRYLWK